MSDVHVTDDGRIAMVRLSRPDKLNALTEQMLYEIGESMHSWDDGSSVRTIIMIGEGRAFCTGADLGQALEVKTGADTLRWNRAWQRACAGIETCRLPVIAAIGGPCVTGGLELALACDLRVTGEDGIFGITSAKIGSVAGGGGTQRLPRLIGVGRAKDLLMSGRLINAQEALTMGIVNRVVPAGTHETAAREWAHELSANAPLSLWWIKWAVNSGLDMPLAAALDWEAALSAHAFVTDDRREGMLAFLEKRKAEFHGR